MKFLSNLVIFLVLIIVIAQATPLKREKKLGPEVSILGVRFKDLYAGLTSTIKSTNSVFDKLIPSFNEAVKDAAKKDGTSKETEKWLLGWNDKYESLVHEVKKNTEALEKSIANLGKALQN
ncbi:9148_t:CDS:1 [Scutellospora calospora]|uniref:9148_t:CDS:1 n=1 Tax=Scutellospora calospora TaxID=85575 RepID=A0ACA9JUL8_9GLOM|nr:9148_t:CDS:1 [Scutellospora calospora]